MKILWFSWKDITHPQAGGAETVTHELLKRAVADGNEVVLITSRPPGSSETAVIDGYRIYRGGSRWSVYWHARKRYLRQFNEWPDVVIDECNTIPFFAAFYVKQPVRMFFHQLCREVWFYQMSWPLSWLGYLLEPIYLRAINSERVITVSQSTSSDLQRYGFSGANIQIISEGIQLQPINNLGLVEKYNCPTLLSLGAIRPMKRTMDVIRAFELAKEQIPELRMIVAGSDSGAYAEKVRAACRSSRYRASIEWAGPVTTEVKLDLLRKSHLVAVASVKEGWCLVVTEANSQGTPAVAYDVDGLRDSIRDEQTGWLSAASPSAMATAIIKALTLDSTYQEVRRAAWVWSNAINFQCAYQDFSRCIPRDSKLGQA